MRSLFGSGAFRRNARAGGGGPGGPPFDMSDLFNGAGGQAGDRRFGGAGFSDLFSSIFSGGAGGAGGRGPWPGARPRRRGRGDARLRRRRTRRHAAADAARSGRLRHLPRQRREARHPAADLPECHGAGRDLPQPGARSASPSRAGSARASARSSTRSARSATAAAGSPRPARSTSASRPGVADGQRIRLAGRGEPGERGGPAGDLFVLVKVRPDELFGRSGDDLTLTVPITFAEAVLGTDLRVPTLDGAGDAAGAAGHARAAARCAPAARAWSAGTARPATCWSPLEVRGAGDGVRRGARRRWRSSPRRPRRPRGSISTRAVRRSG